MENPLEIDEENKLLVAKNGDIEALYKGRVHAAISESRHIYRIY